MRLEMEFSQDPQEIEMKFSQNTQDLELDFGKIITVSGLPKGGSEGDIIVKNSDADQDAGWCAPANDVKEGNNLPVTSDAVYKAIQENAMTTEEKEKLAEIEDGAEVNVIEQVRYFNPIRQAYIPLPVTEKGVNIPQVVFPEIPEEVAFFEFDISEEDEEFVLNGHPDPEVILSAALAGKAVIAFFSTSSEDEGAYRVPLIAYQSGPDYFLKFAGWVDPDENRFITIECKHDPVEVWSIYTTIYADSSAIEAIGFALDGLSDQVEEKYTKPQGGIPASDLDTVYAHEESVAGAVIELIDRIDSKYSKPNDGIPASDLAPGVIPTVPAKTSDLTNDSGFVNAAGAAAAAPVQSVNGKTGAVKLNAADVGAGTYSKPSGGIPKGDLADEVQASLGKADTALQEHQSLADYRTATDQDAIDEAQDTAISGKLDANGNAYRAVSIPIGQLDSTSTATVMTATVPGITELRDGVCMWLKNGVISSASGFTLNINGLGAKPVYGSLAAATRSTTVFGAAYTMLFIYNSTRVDGGCWDCVYGYDSNTNTIGYQLRTNSSTRPVSDQTGRYRLLFSSADNTKWVPANTSNSTNATSTRAVNQRPINPFGEIVYYSYTTVYAAGTNVGTSYQWSQYVLTLGYSFNRTGAALSLIHPAPVYIKCAPQSDGSAIIDEDLPYVQSLPNFEDGSIYIYLGMAATATTVEITSDHPVYCYRDGAIRAWTGPAVSLTAEDVGAIPDVGGQAGVIPHYYNGQWEGLHINDLLGSGTARFIQAYVSREATGDVLTINDQIDVLYGDLTDLRKTFIITNQAIPRVFVPTAFDQSTFRVDLACIDTVSNVIMTASLYPSSSDGIDYDQMSGPITYLEFGNGKLSQNQGTANARKFLMVGDDGIVTPTDLPVYNGGVS